MGFFDNENDCYINLPEMINGLWLIHNDTNELYILPREAGLSFDIQGDDDKVIETILSHIEKQNLTDDQLQDDEILAKLGFSYCPPWQRRFSAHAGYFFA